MNCIGDQKVITPKLDTWKKTAAWTDNLASNKCQGITVRDRPGGG